MIDPGTIDEKELQGIDFAVLSGMKPVEEVSKSDILACPPGEYPIVEDMLAYINKHKDDPYSEISFDDLSVNGKVVQDTMEEYLKDRSISSGNLKEALKTPLHFLYDYNQVFEEKDKSHFELGTFAHMAFLEPELFDKVAVAPEVSLATKDGVIRMINFFQELKGEKPSFFDDWKMQELKERLADEKAKCQFQIIQPEHKIIIDVLKKHYYNYGGGILQYLFKGAKSETSFYGIDEATGLNLRVRPDAFNIEENIGVNAVISLKTTRCDSIGKFAYDFGKLKYELSEGMYQEVMSNVTGRKFNVTIMVMLQTVPPYSPAVLWLGPATLQLGKYKFHYALSVVKECNEKDFFPGFDSKAEMGNNGIIMFDGPQWSFREEHPTDIDDE